MSAESVTSNGLWSYNPYATYVVEDNLSTDQLTGLFNKGQGYVFKAEVSRPSSGTYGHSLKLGERTLMVCGYQQYYTVASGNTYVRRQASSPTDVTQAIELNLMQSGAEALVSTAAAVLAVTAALAF